MHNGSSAEPITLNVDRYESSYISMWMEDGILCARYADDLHVSLEVAKIVVEARIFFSKGQSYPLWVDMKGIKSTTREARRYLASVGATLVTAAALITGSTVNRTIGNIFLKIDKPPVPIKLFTDGERAMDWVKEYLD